ncbi:MAG: hypothetical protein JO333_03045 [Verrucomicrobia bacterium]|nr:hypothetical protein [Verrucomicrobiota bacterium]
MIPAIQATDKVATPHPWGVDIIERFFIACLIRGLLREFVPPGYKESDSRLAEKIPVNKNSAEYG